MKRIFPEFTYGPGPRNGCWWDETIAAPDWPVLDQPVQADVAFIGGGFTGMSAAFHLTERGRRVALLEAQIPVGAHPRAMVGSAVLAASKCQIPRRRGNSDKRPRKITGCQSVQP